MTLLVSIHDVTPRHEEAVRQLWSWCTSHEIVPALLVVPRWHGRWALPEHPSFVAWLRSCRQLGGEIVLHGWRHDEVGTCPGLGHRIQAWQSTLGEGEFLALSRVEAASRIRRGKELLDSLAIPPLGFVAPGWLPGRYSDSVAARLGLEFTEDAGVIRLHGSNRRVRAPACRWSSRSRFRRLASDLVARARLVGQRRSEWFRVALHPGEVRYRETRESVVRTIDRLTAIHQVGSYSMLIRNA